MNIESTHSNIATEGADAVVATIWKNSPLTGAAAELDAAMNGLLTQLIEAEEISADRLAVATVYPGSATQSPLAVVVGLGEKDDRPAWLAYRAAAAAAKSLAAKSRQRVTYFFDELSTANVVAGAMTGCVGQDIYRREKKLHPFSTLAFATMHANELARGQILGNAIDLTRRLVNLPANDIFPESFADECLRVGNQCGIEVEVWDQERLAQENCGALLAVARGSERPPRLVIMRYSGGDPSAPALGLVGKGVTFDSGGLSLKPSASMLDMKCDMAGGATVVGAMQAIASSQLPVNVMGFIGLAENMVSGNSYRLGDVLTSRSGKTIEVHNTDAEGRLVLADTLDVACQSGVSHLIDLATLTGACMVALGRDVVGLMTNNEVWGRVVLDGASLTGEPVWQLPMFSEYGEQIKSEVADIKNVGDGRWGGAITAGKFLEEFVQGTPWVHLDIAGPSFAEKPSAWLDAGASGCMVQTLFQVAMQWPQTGSN